MITTAASRLENYEIIDDGIMLTCACHFGIGLLTAFVEGFAKFFGFENGLVDEKIERAQSRCLNQLRIDARKNNYDAVINVHMSVSGLTVIATGQAVKIRKNDEVLMNENERVKVINDNQENIINEGNTFTNNSEDEQDTEIMEDGITVRVISEKNLDIENKRIKYNNCLYGLFSIREVNCYVNVIYFVLSGYKYKLIVQEYNKASKIYNELKRIEDGD